MPVSFSVGDWSIRLVDYSRPREIAVEVTTRCNLSCIHCFRYASRSLKLVDMSFDAYKRIVDNAAESGVKKLVLTGWGEPTANKHWLEMIKYAKSRGMQVVLNTNGMLIGDACEDLVSIGVDEVYVSIDAADVALYEKVRRLGDLSVVTKNVARLSELKLEREARKPTLKTIFTITKLNVGELEKLVKYVIEVGIQEVYLSFYVEYPGGAQGLNCLDDPECLAKVKKAVEKLSATLVNAPIKLWAPNIESYTSRECPFAANKALYVRVDGKVAPCMFLAHDWEVVLQGTRRRIREYVIGDALRESLVGVWRRHAKMYFKLYFNYMPSCLDCPLRNWCSYTLSTEVDCWGNEPNCSFCPYHYGFSYCPL